MEEKKRIETKKNEIRYFTSKPQEMIGRYLAKNLLRTWREDFVDEDTGETVSIERNEIIAHGGRYIDKNLLAEIQFFLDTKSIYEVEVSNQKREANLVVQDSLVLWTVTAMIGLKKHKLLLYAANIYMALDIARDYIELNYSGGFALLMAKEFNNCIILRGNYKRAEPGADNEELEDEEDQEADAGRKYYQVDTRIHYDEFEYPQAFIVHSVDVDTAMIFINNWIYSHIKEKYEKLGQITKTVEFKTTIESAVVVPCSRTVEREFSLAYAKTNEEY